MSVQGTSRSAAHDRPLFGWRRKPGRLVLAVFRLPLTAYRHNAGPAVGRTFVAFTHTGRRTGRPHQTVAMVLRYDRTTGEVVCCACWGTETDWYRNVRAHPAVQVQLGGETFAPKQRFLPEQEAADVLIAFRRAHPHRLRLMSTLMGWDDLGADAAVREFVHTRPFVAFRPAEDGAPPQAEAAPER